MPKTVDERIQAKKDTLAKIKDRIANDQAKAAKLQKEITMMETLEVSVLIKEARLPVSEVRSLLEELKAKKK
jgi:hypothetical protein